MSPQKHLNTRLIDAASQGDTQGCLELLEQGAQLWAKNNLGWTPLHRTVAANHLDTCRALLQHGAKVSYIDGDNRTPLHLAAQRGHLSICTELLGFKADINAKDDFYDTPLHLAVRTGCHDVVEMLIANDANLEARNSMGKTALMQAGKHPQVCLLLLEAGAKIEARDKNDRCFMDDLDEGPVKLVVRSWLARQAALQAITSICTPS